MQPLFPCLFLLIPDLSFSLFEFVWFTPLNFLHEVSLVYQTVINSAGYSPNKEREIQVKKARGYSFILNLSDDILCPSLSMKML